MRLEDWSIQRGLYKAPEQGGRLAGYVYGHPTRSDGQHILTSTVVTVNHDAETITTYSGSVYELGEVDPMYEEKFPGAKGRIFHGELVFG